MVFDLEIAFAGIYLVTKFSLAVQDILLILLYKGNPPPVCITPRRKVRHVSEGSHDHIEDGGVVMRRRFRNWPGNSCRLPVPETCRHPEEPKGSSWYSVS